MTTPVPNGPSDSFFSSSFSNGQGGIHTYIVSGSSIGNWINWIPPTKEEDSISSVNDTDMTSRVIPPTLEDSKIPDLRTILTLIFNTFSSRANCLNCFYVHGKSSERICFQYLNSLPVFRISPFKDGSTTCSFSADWNGDKKLYQGWEDIPDNELERTEQLKKSISYKAKSVFVLPNITKIRLYEWGFEILNGGNIELVAVLSYALTEKPEQSLHKTPWTVPFKNEFLGSSRFIKPFATWDKDASNKLQS